LYLILAILGDGICGAKLTCTTQVPFAPPIFKLNNGNLNKINWKNFGKSPCCTYASASQMWPSKRHYSTTADEKPKKHIPILKRVARALGVAVWFVSQN
jgi:hypothetical protein